MEPSMVNRLVDDYPFYQLPLVAKLLNKNTKEQLAISELNFFGFNGKKLENYAHLYATIDNTESNIDEDSDGQESEVSFHDIRIDVSESSHSGHLTKPALTEEDSAETSLSKLDLPGMVGRDLVKLDIDESPNTETNIDPLDIESEITTGADIVPDEQQENSKSEETNVHEDQAPVNEKTVETSETLELGNLTQSSSSEILDTIDIEFSPADESIEEEWADRLSMSNEIEEKMEALDLSQPNFDFSAPLNASLDLEIDYNNTASDEELAEKLKLDTHAQLDLESKDIEGTSFNIQTKSEENQPNQEADHNPSLEIELIKIDLEFAKLEADDSIVFDDIAENNYILPAAYEIITNQSQTDEALNADTTAVSASNTNELAENSTDAVFSIPDTEIKDFSAWLASFSPQIENSQNLTSHLGKQEADSAQEDELNKSIQANALQLMLQESMIQEDDELTINRDNELEGVLKDNFFKTQVEIKKVSRKTPSDMRVQDEAQLSLQPLDLVSETLAILYLQQGNTTKAIEIYEKLITLIPEKSGFFALQIENLRK
ncbi:MAG: hypothetical protein ACK5UE_12935 [Chitinophagales bacterium]|nr:hypothetical protein [Sphingobacteriales bacterium]